MLTRGRGPIRGPGILYWLLVVEEAVVCERRESEHPFCECLVVKKGIARGKNPQRVCHEDHTFRKSQEWQSVFVLLRRNSIVSVTA